MEVVLDLRTLLYLCSLSAMLGLVMLLNEKTEEQQKDSISS